MKESTARFGWFWCNDEEMFPKDGSALDRKMELYAKRGITHVILFGVTHFRWAFRPHWDVIRDCLHRVCEAGHRHGIKVIEHHSAILSYYPATPEYESRMENFFRIRKSSPDSWAGFREYQLDMTRPDRKWIQIHGSTGKPVEAYGGFAICPSNDEFVEEYLKELEKEYDCGLDGIMTDDVQFFGPCGCDSCRRKFQERTSFILPEKEKWAEWFGNMQDPAFRAWMRFRHEIVREFHCKVKAHYEKLGRKMLRPNYVANALAGNSSGYCVDDLPELHWIFQECMYGSIIRYSFPVFFMESLHRRMVAERRNIPHMLMFYAEHPDTLRFTWALAHLAGAMFTNAPHNVEELDETPLRKYEQAHAEELFDASMMSRIAFLDSLENRHLDVAYEAGRGKFWIQSCFFSNIPCDLVGTEDTGKWHRYSVLCVIDLHLLREQEIRNLLAYAENGGTLVLTGTSGFLGDDGEIRNGEEWEKLWQIPQNHTASETMTWKKGKGKIITLGYAFGYPETDEEAYRHFERFSDFYKFGAVHTLMPMRKDCVGVWTARFSSEKTHVYNGEYSKGEKARDTVIKFLLGLTEMPICCQVPDLVLVTAWKSADGKNIFLRLLNASGTLKGMEGKTVSHEDMPPFPVHNREEWHFTVEIEENFEGKAEFETLSFGPVALRTVRMDSKKLNIFLPSGFLKDFGVIRIG